MESIKNVIEICFKELQSPEKLKRRTLAEAWATIVGEKIAKHTKPSLDQQGVLRICVDQSTLAFELRQRYQQTILKRAQTSLGEETVKTIRFYVGQLR